MPTGQRAVAVSEDAPDAALFLLAARLARQEQPREQSSDALARVYTVAANSFVRDPRTGHRHRRPRDVLAGDLDEFLLAYLRA